MSSSATNEAGKKVLAKSGSFSCVAATAAVSVTAVTASVTAVTAACYFSVLFLIPQLQVGR